MSFRASKCYGSAKNLAEAVTNKKIPGTTRSHVNYVKFWMKNNGYQRTDFSKWRSGSPVSTESEVEDPEYVIQLNITFRSIVDKDLDEDSFVRDLVKQMDEAIEENEDLASLENMTPLVTQQVAEISQEPLEDIPSSDPLDFLDDYISNIQDISSVFQVNQFGTVMANWAARHRNKIQDYFQKSSCSPESYDAVDEM